MRTVPSSVADMLWPKARQGILGLLLVDPERELHLREIVRRTGMAPATVQREVTNLTAAEILTRRADGGQVYYRANVASPIYADLRGLVIKTVGLADVLRNALTRHDDGITVAAVFGSMASGDAATHSDVDLLVIGQATLRELAPAIQGAERALAREVNAVVMATREWAERLDASDHFVSAVARGPLLFIIGGADELAGLDGSSTSETS